MEATHFDEMTVYFPLIFCDNSSSLSIGIKMTQTQKQILFNATRMHSELVYNMTKLEGNPYTYPEVKTLLDGITVGGIN